MNKKLVAAVLATAVVLGGCASKSASTGGSNSSGSSSNAPKIGVTIYKFDDNFMSFVRQSIEKGAKDKAELTLNDSQNDQSKQLEQIDAMISKGVKALAINLVDPKAAGNVIEKAEAAKLPVIFFNKEPDAAALASYDKAWYVGTLSKESGVMQGELIADEWKKNAEKWDLNKDGKIQYVLLKGEPGHPDAEARTKYVVDTIVEKGIGVEKIAEDTAMWDTNKAAEKMDAWLAKNEGKIELVIANNDAMALGAVTSLEKVGYFKNDKFMPVFGVDAIPDALAKIKEGKMVGTVLNDAKNQGQATLDLAINAANGKDVLDGTKWKLDDKKAVRVPYVKINKDNVNTAEEAYK
ncbi:galactose/glucose ABC transporter substrate-binding protein MglB [Clostridium sp. SYSU_GA19001]|uniref:galactose/glucose ABC transporter substrate-binding protein MglB n=1 Tax=Clostridium caldaquaticum TaxID=2940653 RepID=UPI002076E380|nr:galactose/glucose ABC transporter substrate-binding protein MglB [Clostridium caldaquaticum]MCM8709485.1 galactose/glucose ABC transporter substrate-binding protein MglB [Clostridium caldaquaticum]